VSSTYLIENVIPSCGGDRLDGKTDVIYNGCDWDHDQIEAAALSACRPELESFLGKNVTKHASRHDLRRFLGTWKLGHLPPGEPVIDDPDLLQIIKQFDGKPPFMENGRVTSFPADGKLCMITGRASKQKGMDTMLDAIPLVLAEYPAINFLVFSLPTQGEKGLITTYTARAMEPVMRDHVRYAWGKAGSIFTLAHLAADLYLAPSRWEPFGIMVLEANALGLPVIGASVGGIKETIIDARENNVGGTGLLIEKENPAALASAIVDMTRAIDACEANDPSIAVHITDIRLKRAVIKNPGLYETMCSNSRKHVEKSFRWAMVARKELDLIAKAIANKQKRQ
jgi:glycosyltransferase involved in cell wall biosynthesis